MREAPAGPWTSSRGRLVARSSRRRYGRRGLGVRVHDTNEGIRVPVRGVAPLRSAAATRADGGTNDTTNTTDLERKSLGHGGFLWRFDGRGNGHSGPVPRQLCTESASAQTVTIWATHSAFPGSRRRAIDTCCDPLDGVLASRRHYVYSTCDSLGRCSSHFDLPGHTAVRRRQGWLPGPFRAQEGRLDRTHV